MTTLLAITDPSDTLLLHADPACDSLHALVDHAERLLGEPVADVEAIVEAAATLGLLVEITTATVRASTSVDGPAASSGDGGRWCAGCRPPARSRGRHPRPAVHALAA